MGKTEEAGILEIEIHEIIRTKRKSVALCISPEGLLTVRAPLKTSEARIREIVQKKSGWIITKQHEAAVRSRLFPPKTFAQGETHLFLGQPYRLTYTDSVKEIEIRGESLLIPQKFTQSCETKLKNWYKKQAAQVFGQKLTELSQKTGIRYQTVKITDARKRWGSCGAGGIIHFNWRSVMAPSAVIDYLTVHELCHIPHLNHSRAFWAAVASILPDYKERETWLKQNGWILNLL
jgi:predicted metal-dependent hydrolase